MSSIDYRDIFDRAAVGIALNDPDQGTIGRVNDRYAELMGYAREDLWEMKIEEISAEDPTFDQAAAMEKIQQALAGDPQRFDWLFERQDGSQFWGEVVLKRTTIGDSDRLVAFVRDISERKQYETKLEEQNQRLEEFASIVSHDLRNPLRTASGYLDLVRQDCDSEHLDAIERAHDRMETLIEDILALAQAGESIIETRPVSLQPLLKECWGAIETEDAALEIETTATIQADEARLRQLLENLFQNAVMHGGNAVTVTVGDLEDGFFVADDGPGIPDDEQREIFEAGYSSHEAGTGFGLRIVEQVVDVHDWEIRLTESEDGGARFEITSVQRE